MGNKPPSRTAAKPEPGWPVPPGSRCQMRPRSPCKEEETRGRRGAYLSGPRNPLPKSQVQFRDGERCRLGSGLGLGGGGTPWTPGLRARLLSGLAGGVGRARCHQGSCCSAHAASELLLGLPRRLETASSLFSLSVLPRRLAWGFPLGTFQSRDPDQQRRESPGRELRTTVAAGRGRRRPAVPFPASLPPARRRNSCAPPRGVPAWVTWLFRKWRLTSHPCGNRGDGNWKWNRFFFLSRFSAENHQLWRTRREIIKKENPKNHPGVRDFRPLSRFERLGLCTWWACRGAPDSGLPRGFWEKEAVTVFLSTSSVPASPGPQADESQVQGDIRLRSPGTLKFTAAQPVLDKIKNRNTYQPHLAPDGFPVAHFCIPGAQAASHSGRISLWKSLWVLHRSCCVPLRPY